MDGSETSDLHEFTTDTLITYNICIKNVPK